MTPDKRTEIAQVIYEASPIIQYPNLDCIGDQVALPWEGLHEHERATAFKQADAVLATLQPSLDTEEDALRFGHKEIEKLQALRRLCEASGQPFYVEILDEVIPELARQRNAAIDKALAAVPDGEQIEKPDGFTRMHFEECDYFKSRGTKSCNMDCCS